MVNVTKDNFLEVSDEFLKHLSTAAYVSIDEEMTGISLPGSNNRRPAKDDTCAQRYERQKSVPETYSIIQMGVCLFHHVENDGKNEDGKEGKSEYMARPYNFYLFPTANERNRNGPPPRDITLSASAIQFLNKHGMDFGMWTKSGIHYITNEAAIKLVRQLEIQQYGVATTPMPGETASDTETPKSTTHPVIDPNKTNPTTLAGITAENGAALGVTPPSRKQKKVELTRQQDIEFVSRTMAHLREWLDNSTRAIPAIPEGSDASQYSQLILPSCNAFLRRALYESIAETYPSLILEKGQGQLHKDSIVVFRLSQEEKQERQIEKQMQIANDLKLQMGFTRIYQALVEACRGTFDPRIDANGNVHYLMPRAPPDSPKDEKRASPTSGIPIVVHNGLMDLLFLMTHFVSPTLPDRWQDAKSMIHDQFPTVYDTKCLAEEYVDPNQLPIDSTVLAGLYSTLCRHAEDTNGSVTLHPDFAHRYQNGGDSEDKDQTTGAHEAAYDAFMTGACFHHLLYAILSRNSHDKVSVRVHDAHRHLHRNIIGTNKLLCWGTLYNIDLEANEPTCDPFKRGLHPRCTFRVSDFDSAVSTRDIHAALKVAEDSEQGRNTYEIIWINDTSFMVAAKNQQLWIPVDLDLDADHPEELRQHVEMANTIMSMLKRRFGDDKVVPLHDFLQRKNESEAAPITKRKRGLLDSVMSSIVGYWSSASSTENSSKKRKHST